MRPINVYALNCVNRVNTSVLTMDNINANRVHWGNTVEWMQRWCKKIAHWFKIIVLSEPTPMQIHAHIVHRGNTDLDSPAKRVLLDSTQMTINHLAQNVVLVSTKTN